MKPSLHYLHLFAALSLLLTLACAEDDSFPPPLHEAYAHNDYQHPRPLWDALDAGFTSIEADIHRLGDSLYVAHDPEDIVSGRTLQALYLEPLNRLSQMHRQSLYPRWPTLHLMIDFKTAPETTWPLLAALLEQYRPMLTRWHHGRRDRRAVTVLLSGNRPAAAALGEEERLAALDGRLSDLQGTADPDLYPWISESWQDHFRWRGRGPMPAAERGKLDSLVQITERRGFRLRFWAADSGGPEERQAMWRELGDAGVSLINTDDLPGLGAFLGRREAASTGD